MRDRAPVYDDRRSMRQYDVCTCGRVKGKQAKQCFHCFRLVQRKRDWLRQLRRGHNESGA